MLSSREKKTGVLSYRMGWNKIPPRRLFPGAQKKDDIKSDFMSPFNGADGPFPPREEISYSRHVQTTIA